MRADIFTKVFVDPLKWRSACQLIGLSSPSEIAGMIQRSGLPTPRPEGGGKLGVWCFNSDGSGKWTRVDHRATKFASLYTAGPELHEVTSRRTFDADSGEELGAPMLDFSCAKFRNLPLPDPIPRSIRSVFTFQSTSKSIPPEHRNQSAGDVPG